MLTEEELEAELSSFKPPVGRGVRKRAQEAEAEEEYDEEPAPPRRTTSVMVAPRRRVSRLIEEDDEERPTRRKVERDIVGVAPVPFVLQEAAVLLLEQSKVRLSADTQAELQMAFVQRPSEFCVVDPPVVLCASVDTGTISIKCKEIVPISLHLMALAVQATFSLQVTPKVRTQDEPWAEAVVAKPCRNAQGCAGMTPVGTLAAVQKALERIPNAPEDLDARVARYMANLKPFDSIVAADSEWMEPHVEALRAICYGTRSDDEPQDIRAKLARLRGESATPGSAPQ